MLGRLLAKKGEAALGRSTDMAAAEAAVALMAEAAEHLRISGAANIELVDEALAHVVAGMETAK